jgi:4-amino-4-deoxy-L-arabinose transferase-like glycosyltransferase
MNRLIFSKFFPLILIFIVALFVRVYALGQMPLHLHQDEIMNGYVGRFILENGKDLYGNRLPVLYFDNFGDFPSVVPMYISGFFTYIFGLTEFAIRFPIALAGALSVLPVYLIAKKATYSEHAGRAAAIFLALSPWHIVLSRATSEAVIGTMLLLFGIVFLLRVFEEQKYIPNAVMAFLFFLSTYFFYHPFRIVVPLLLLGALVLHFKTIYLKPLAIMCIFFFLLTFGISKTHWGLGRFSQTSVFTFNNATNNRIDMYARDAGQNHSLDLKIFNNKPIVYAREIIRQYFSYLSPNFLFTDGGRPYRYVVPDQGLLQISLFGLTVFVVAVLLTNPGLLAKQKWNPTIISFIGWLVLIAPLTASLTLDEVPNVHRSAIFGILLTVFFACIYFRFVSIKTFVKPLLAAFWIVFILETVYFFHQYIVLAPAAQSPTRYDSRTLLAKQLITQREKYTNIVVPREIFSIYYLYYTKNFDSNLAGKFQKNLIIPEVDNLNFIDNDCPTQEKDLPLKDNTLIVDMQHCVISDKYEKIDVFTGISIYRTYIYKKQEAQAR